MSEQEYKIRVEGDGGASFQRKDLAKLVSLQIIKEQATIYAIEHPRSNVHMPTSYSNI